MKEFQTECIICDVHMAHFHHEAMNMGCRCNNRVCRHCVETGEVKNCPTCRKRRAQPSMDRRWFQTFLEWYGHKTLPCVGCDRAVVMEALRCHERSCPKYRDYLENMLSENTAVYKIRASKMEEENKELEERVEVQNESIEELEEECHHLECLIQTHEMERQLYDFEGAEMTKLITHALRPLNQVASKVTMAVERLTKVREMLQSSRKGHRLLHQKRLRYNPTEEDAHDFRQLPLETEMAGSASVEPVAMPATESVALPFPPTTEPVTEGVPTPQLSPPTQSVS